MPRKPESAAKGCPLCGKPTNPDHAPFCSRGCKDRDLLKWLGVGYRIPQAGVRINADLLNAFQSKGLEEGNPRLQGVGAQQFFVARPLLPRRFMLGITYDFGAGGGTALEPAPGQ